MKGNNHLAAKQHLNDCMNMNPGDSSCFVFHNLAVAQWWHVQKYQNAEIKLLVGPDLVEYKRAVLEFTEALPNLQKAIQLFEDLADPFDLDAKNTVLKNKISGKSLSVMTEILFQSDLYDETVLTI